MRRLLLTTFGILVFLPSLLAAQAAEVRVEENVRAEPNGVLLGQLRPGIVVDVDRSEGDWMRFTLEGWVWARSLQVIDREGFDLVVTVEGGENLREAPSGTILGRLEEGTLLEELERVPGWVRVRRRMWIWAESVELGDEQQPSVESGERSGSAEPRFRSAGSSGLAVLSAPDGDTLVEVRPGSEVQLLAREGNWARVRVEGWSWIPESGEGVEEAPVLTDVGPGQVVGAPDRYRGRLVEWELQFVSLERAEAIRTDFYEGEPFLLTRTTGGEALFVYVAVPPERLGEVEGLMALQRVRILGRIRVASASLTGNPIIDLLELRTGQKP